MIDEVEKVTKIVIQNNDFLIVDKPYDVHINNNDDAIKLTVANQLCQLVPNLVDNSINFGFRFVNRLDYATSGLLCIALNRKAANAARKIFMAKQVTKEYLALVRGHVPNHKGVINKAIGIDLRDTRGFRMCTQDEDQNCQSPQHARTHFQVLNYGTYDGESITKVALRPITGRRHQLRLHCLALGHCIVGDYTYSNQTDIKPYRMMLHSYKLKLPLNDNTLEASTSDPFIPEMDSLLELSIMNK